MADTESAALDLCDAIGLPYAAGGAFRSDAEGADGPHVVLRHEGTRKLVADNRAWARVDQWSVTLYTAERDPASEGLVEDAFDACGIVPSDPMEGYDADTGVRWAEWDFELVR